MKNTVSLILPEKVPAVLGHQVTVAVGVTDFSGSDREILVRLIGSLSGPLPAVAHLLRAHLSIQAEVSMQVPSGMPPGAHPILIEVLDRTTGLVIGSGEVILDVQHTQAIRMHLSPPSIRRRLRGRIRVVLRNHDDETHHIRLRAETDDSHTQVKLWNQDVELRAGEMVRLKGRLRVRPFFIGKQREHWYSIIGDGAGTPIYGRGNIRHIPMIGRNIKSLMGLMCIVLVWAGATLAIIRAVNPVTSESAASAEEGQGDTNNGEGTTGGELELPNLIDVSGTVTAVPDGSNVTVKWRSVSLGDVEGSGKIGGQNTTSNPNVASLSTTTNAEGAFSVSGLDGAGLYEFTFAKAGHSTKTLIVQPQGEAVTLEVELSVGDGIVSGYTVDENGQVLGGVDVTLSDGIITYQTTTPSEGDQKGFYSFLNLSTPGTYVIDAKVSQRGLASTTFNLEAGASQTDLVLTLSPNVATLAGRVSSMLFEANSAPSRQAAEQSSNALALSIPAVTIIATDGVISRSTTTLTDIELAGTFRLQDLPINRVYTVTYSVEGFTTYTETVELTFATPNRDISLNRSTGQLSGSVLVESEDILPQSVGITIANVLQTYKSSDLVRSDGSFDFNGIAPGSYVATFEALGLKDQYREIVIGAGTTTTLDVTLTEVDDTSKSSSLSFVAAKNGEDTNSLAPAAVMVTVKHRASDDCGQVGSDTDCTYETVIDPGTATTTVLIDKLDAGAYYLIFTAEGFSPKVVQTNVALGERKDQIAVTLDALGTLSGQVTDDSGSPVEGVQLLLTSATGVTKSGGTGPNGEFVFPNSLDAMTYTLETTSPNFTSVSRTVTGALNASVNVDATVRGISMVTGEVRSLNLISGNYEAIETKNFSVFYRTSRGTISAPVVGGWIDTKTIGISKSLGSFRLGVNPVDANGNPLLIDACIAINDGTKPRVQLSSYSITGMTKQTSEFSYTTNIVHGLVVGDTVDIVGFANSDFNAEDATVTNVVDATTFNIAGSTNSDVPPTGTAYDNAIMSRVDNVSPGTTACDAAITSSLSGINKIEMPAGLIAKSSTSVGLKAGETAVRSVYFTPSPGSVTGYVTVGSVPENDVKIEARRIGPDGRVYETVNASTATNPSNNRDGYFFFDYLTPTSPVAPADYSEVSAPCDQTVSICWSIRATKTSVGSKDSATFTVYPSKRLNLPDSETVNIELGRGTASVTLSADTGVVFANTPLTLTATINGIAKNQTATTDTNGKAVFSGLELGTWTLQLPATDDFAQVSREFAITQGVSLNESVVRRSLRGKLIVYLRGPGGPLSGAEIRLATEGNTTTTSSTSTTTIANTPDPTVLCVSIADGSCTIDNYATGVHTFIASASGLSSTTISASVIGGQTIAISAQLGAASGTLTVTLLDVLGTKLVGATITAKDQNFVDYSCTTSTLGICTLTGIPFGIVDVQSIAENFRDSYGSISIGTGGSAMTLIATPTNGKATFVFVDDNGQSLIPTKAEYIDSSGNVLNSCNTTTTNQCIMTGLPQGLATIRATVTGVNASQYAPVTLKVSVFPGLDTAATFVIPTANAALAGFVVEDKSDGTSSVVISGAIVTATDAAGKSEVTLTDDSGRYSFSTLTPGSWTIRSTAPGYASKTLAAISLPNTDLQIRLIPLAGSIELSVRSPIGGPATGISVVVQRNVANADVYTIITGTDGNALFNEQTIVEGTYTVTITDSIIPARYVSQTFVLNVDRGSSTRFAAYLGTYGAFLAIPISGIPASSFGPSTPLSVDVALLKDGLLMHQVTTEMVANQMVASFAGVGPGTYSISIQSPNNLANQQQFSITAIAKDFGTRIKYTTSVDHALAVDDYVDIFGFTTTLYNFDNAAVTQIIDARNFIIEKNTGNSPLPSNSELTNAKYTKINNQTQWPLTAHTIYSNSTTYDVPVAPTVDVPELSRVITLGMTTLIVTPVDFDVVVSGIPFTDPVVPTTTTASSTMPLLSNAKVTLSDGYLLNSVSSITDANGRAAFTAIPPGTYTATVTNTSFDDFVTSIEIVDQANPAGNNPRISLNQTPITGKIKVTVFGDGNSSNFVSGATVSILENNVTCVTDSSGICSLNNLAQGDYNLRVIHPSYAAINTSPIHVTGGMETTHSVGLGFNEGQVDFTVFNSATGLPIAGSDITAQVPGTAPTCTTNASGKCSVTGLALGATSFRVEAGSFDIGFIGVDVTGGNSTKISINLTPSLPTTETLKVRTVDAVTGRALNGVLISNADDESVLCTTTGQTTATPPVALGACNGLSIAVGNLSVMGELENYETAFATVVISPIYSTTLVLALRPKLGSLQFDIFHAITKSPLATATVTMVEPPMTDCTTALDLPTNTASCTISSLVLQNTTFLVEKEGFDNLYVSYGISNEGGRVRLELTPSDNTLIINTVDAVTGLALAGVEVNHGTNELCTTIGAGANCTTPPQATGSYSLSLSKAGYEDQFATVLVRPNAPTSLTFALRPTFGSVEFIIKDAVTGALIPSARIESVNDAADTCTTPSGSGTTGRCTIGNLSLVATQFEITASSYNDGFTNVSVTNVAGSEITVLLNKDSVGFKVYTFDAVTDLPLNGITVEYADGETFCSAVTSTGYCSSVSNIPGGTITLKAFKENSYLPVYATTTFDTSEPASLSLALLPTNGSVEISVVNGNDESEINGVTITRSPSESVCTTASGSGCTIPSMPVGTYVFTATKTGYTTATITATIVNSDISYLSMTMYPVTNSQLLVYTYNASTGSPLNGVSVTRADGSALCSAITAFGYCTATGVATGSLNLRASLSGHETTYGNVTIESSGSETVHLYLQPTSSTLTVTVLNSFDSAAVSGASISISGGSCGSTSGSGTSTCTGLTSGNLSLSVSAGNFTAASATIAIARGTTNSIVLYLRPLGHLTVSTTKKATAITVTAINYNDLCTIPALSGTEAPTTESCTGYSLPYGTYIISLNTSPVKTATVTINKTWTSLTIS
jgi:hypothetical protein